MPWSEGTKNKDELTQGAIRLEGTLQDYTKGCGEVAAPGVACRGILMSPVLVTGVAALGWQGQRAAYPTPVSQHPGLTEIQVQE